MQMVSVGHSRIACSTLTFTGETQMLLGALHAGAPFGVQHQKRSHCPYKMRDHLLEGLAIYLTLKGLRTSSLFFQEKRMPILSTILKNELLQALPQEQQIYEMFLDNKRLMFTEVPPSPPEMVRQTRRTCFKLNDGVDTESCCW